jgi:tyrosinase
VSILTSNNLSIFSSLSSGFDPIFFLHHSNVDRMLSLWAAINPGVWVTPSVAEDGGSFTTEPGAPVNTRTGMDYSADLLIDTNLASALTPFYNTQLTFWPSAFLQDTSELGYTYPDFNGLDPGDTDATKTAIANRVNQLYGFNVFGFNFLPFGTVPPSIPASIKSVADTAKKVPATSPSHNSADPQQHTIPGFVRSLAGTAQHAPAPQQHTLSTQVTATHQTVHGQSSAAPDRGVWEWTARVEFKKYELGTSFSVLIFLGQVPENPRELRTSPSYLGGHHAFVNSAANSCANCRNQRDLVIEGFVHLNHGIAKQSGLGSLEPNVIVPYLTENLQWVVQKVPCLSLLYLQICTYHCLSVNQTNGEVVGLDSLEVAVFATPLSYPPNAIFPVPGQAVRYNQITYGRPGGSRQA